MIQIVIKDDYLEKLRQIIKNPKVTNITMEALKYGWEEASQIQFVCKFKDDDKKHYREYKTVEEVPIGQIIVSDGWGSERRMITGACFEAGELFIHYSGDSVANPDYLLSQWKKEDGSQLGIRRRVS